MIPLYLAIVCVLMALCGAMQTGEVCNVDARAVTREGEPSQRQPVRDPALTWGRWRIGTDTYLRMGSRRCGDGANGTNSPS